MKPFPGEQLPIGSPVTVGNLRGAVIGYLQPQNHNQVIAHRIKFTERRKITFANRGKWFPLPKPIFRACNYSFITVCTP